MNQFIRTDSEGGRMLNAYALDTQQTTEFMAEVDRLAQTVDVDLESEPSASYAERMTALETAAAFAVDNIYLEDNAYITPETRQMIEDMLVDAWTNRYGVTLDDNNEPSAAQNELDAIDQAMAAQESRKSSLLHCGLEAAGKEINRLFTVRRNELIPPFGSYQDFIEVMAHPEFRGEQHLALIRERDKALRFLAILAKEIKD